MMPWGQNYSPTQMLDIASVDTYEYREKLDGVVEQILALFAATKQEDAGKLPEKLREIIRASGRVSISTCLHRLHSIATIGKELEGERDGLDALCYHLSGHCVQKGQQALAMITQRFAQLQRETDEERKRLHEQFQREREQGSASQS